MEKFTSKRSWLHIETALKSYICLSGFITMAITNEKKAALIMAGIVLVEGTFVIMNFLGGGHKFLVYMGFGGSKHGEWPGWLLAVLIVFVYVWQSVKFPSVRANMFRPSWLKLLALGVAVFAGIFEEVYFRKLLMNSLDKQGYGLAVQVLASGVAFGAVHGIWGLFGKSKRAAVGATLATGVLGLLLAVCYLLAGRVVLPCIAAHFLINLLIEPGLVLAAARQEMGKPSA